MPEIKRTFTAGKMNKDLDERLVPNGEYRKALNIQIRTTDGDGDSVGDAGAVQNIKGNSEVTGLNKINITKDPFEDGGGSKIVGSVSDEKNDRSFFFLAAPLVHNVKGKPPLDPATEQKALTHWTDSILEVKSDGSCEPIFVDKIAVTGGLTDFFTGNFGATNYNTILLTGSVGTFNSDHIRVGMRLYAVNSDGEHLIFNDTDQTDPGCEIVSINTSAAPQIVLRTNQQNAISGAVAISFISQERVLQLPYDKLITGANVIGDLLFYTDGATEPKRINIERSRLGTRENSFTSLFDTHTKLFVKNPQVNVDAAEFVNVSEIDTVATDDVLKENITVIKKAPKSAPILFMKNTDREGLIEFNISFDFFPDGAVLPQNGDTFVINDVPAEADILINDILTFTSTNSDLNPLVIRAKVMSTDNLSSGEITIDLILVDPDLINNVGVTNWEVNLEQRKAIFETKFGRVAYRYKYEDNEYSSFSPWSELAFLPGDFLYNPSKGYNKGMVNNLRSLIVTGFIPTSPNLKPSDVKAVDILWKTTDDANVYVIKTVTRQVDLEWFDFNISENYNNGSVKITSELIHRVLPSNQILRTWDNVPKSAIAQEITGSRILYGNYKQGYDITDPIGLKQTIVSNSVDFPAPKKSVKSLRNYKWGLVFGDKYGRETSVIANGFQNNEGESVTGDVTLEKNLSSKSNKFLLQQTWEDIAATPPEWMHYVKYYVKETSSEYYNLIMDRWYDAKDDCVWLSFSSADRNKVDEETYLILKNEHGSQTPVDEDVRYKIIAISNDAPDYIRTIKSNFGLIEFNMDDVYQSGIAPANSSPVRIVGQTEVLLDANNWEGGGNLQKEDFTDQVEVRIVGQFTDAGGSVFQATSSFKEVTKVIIPPTDAGGTYTGGGGFVISEPFTESDVNMLDKITAILPNPGDITIANIDVDGDPSQIRYFMQFRNLQIRNRAEFDGRFFVKIEKDNTLRTRVTSEVSNINYEVNYEVEIAYLQNEVTPTYPGAASYPATLSGFTGSGATLLGISGVTTVDIDGNPLTNGFEQGGYSAMGDADTHIMELFSDYYYWLDELELSIEVDDTNFDLVTPGWAGTYEEDLENPIPVPNFGPGNTDSTYLFWQNWWSQGEEAGLGNTKRKTRIFLDNIPAHHGFTLIKGGLPAVDDPYADLFVGDSGTLTEYTTRYNILPNFSMGDIISWFLPAPVMDPSFMNGWPGSQSIPTSEEIRGIYGPHPSFEMEPYSFYTSNYFRGLYNYSTNVIDAGFGPNYQPVGFGQGAAPDGQIGQMLFSTIGIHDNFGPAGSTEQNFYQDMQTTGTTFRFKGSNTKYKIVDIEQGIDGTSYTYTGDATINSYNYAATVVGGVDTGNLRLRHSFITRFVRLNADGSVSTSGGLINALDLNDFDPRSNVNHWGLADDDGTRGSFTIEILSEELTSAEINEIDVVTQSACWETEPKDNTDIEIYYEASSAIPMRLNSSNIDFYTGASSDLTRLTIASIQNRKLVDGALTTPVPNGVEFIRSGPFVSDVHNNDIIEIKFEDTNGTIQNFNNNRYFGIDDEISFTHYGGLILKSKIVDHIQESNGIYSSHTRYEVAGGFISSADPTRLVFSIAEFEANENFNTIPWVGTNVIGNNFSPGTFVIDLITATQQMLTEIGGGAGAVGDYVLILSQPATTGDAGSVTFVLNSNLYQIETEVYKFPVQLSWFNCYSFGNGVESDRIRDDFNTPTIDNGCRVSSTFLEYGEENIESGLIYSGLYNSNSSVNNLNEFNMAEKITKNINPDYGSIQSLKTRDGDVVVLSEDKIIRVMSSGKDAVFNADGNPQLTATDKVLGAAVPFVGDYGISKNPESMAADQYRIYFSDKQRGAVLRLSRDGLTPISSVGMKTYFREELKKCDNIIGTFDTVNGEYNITLKKGSQWNDVDETVSFNEAGKGWVSFKSFIPSCGESFSGKYFTAFGDKPYEHHVDDAPRNNFYGTQYSSEISVVFNDGPGDIKSFNAINYEGSQANVSPFNTVYLDSSGNVVNEDDVGAVAFTDGEYYNVLNTNKLGWFLEQFKTDLQEGLANDFVEKENKWFNNLRGLPTADDLSNLDASEASVQGLGTILQVDGGVTTSQGTLTITAPPPTGPSFGAPIFSAPQFSSIIELLSDTNILFQLAANGNSVLHPNNLLSYGVNGVYQGAAVSGDKLNITFDVYFGQSQSFETGYIPAWGGSNNLQEAEESSATRLSLLEEGNFLNADMVQVTPGVHTQVELEIPLTLDAEVSSGFSYSNSDVKIIINPFGQQLQEGAFISFGPGPLTAQIISADGTTKAYRQFNISFPTAVNVNGSNLIAVETEDVLIESLTLGLSNALELSIPPQINNTSGVALDGTQFKFTLLTNEITEDENGNFNIDYTNA